MVELADRTKILSTLRQAMAPETANVTLQHDLSCAAYDAIEWLYDFAGYDESDLVKLLFTWLTFRNYDEMVAALEDAGERE